MYRDLQIAEDELLQFAAQKSSAWSASVFVLEDEFYLEGWLSFVWQTWCTFCRKCIVSSAMGTTTGSGHTIPSLAGATTEEFVSGAVIRVAKGKPLVWTANSALRIEPTWGETSRYCDRTGSEQFSNFAEWNHCGFNRRQNLSNDSKCGGASESPNIG
jgi:hypothetical protein